MKSKAWSAPVTHYQDTLEAYAVYKHAQATRVKIRLRQLERAVTMEIVDNGRAFSVSNPVNGRRRQPLGLLGMQERVRLVNGQVAIESIPRRGTTVRVQITLSGHELLQSAGRLQAAATVSN